MESTDLRSSAVEPGVAALLARAVHRVDATEANGAIAQMRVQEGEEGKPATSYEVVLPLAEPGRYLTEVLMPRLVYFLDCSGFKLPSCRGVFLSIFLADKLFFIRVSDAVEELSKLSGIAPDEMVERFGAAAR